MQQVIAHHFPSLPPMGNSALAFFPALALAVLSWHAVEKQAIKFKNIPARLHERFLSRYSQAMKRGRATVDLLLIPRSSHDRPGIVFLAGVAWFGVTRSCLNFNRHKLLVSRA
jgi:hypothetical protein